ncbi:MAG TPA: hypothetical protein VFB79_03970 [Candidatus Angelobacter sp.]|nr:hypothetical protein [Candidatus Angelobacter sp.]
MKPRKIAVLVLLLTTLLFSEKRFNPPPAAHASTYALHEAHTDEKVTIAVDPCDTPEKKGVFKTDYMGYALYPVRLMISNDSDQTLMLDDLKVEYITAAKDKLPPATNDDIYRRLVKPGKVDEGKPGMRLPFPVGKKKPINKETEEEYQTAQFQKVPVTPHSTNSGYLFFDMVGMDNPGPGAHIYISGIRAGTQELFYFDIPMDKQQSPPPAR